MMRTMLWRKALPVTVTRHSGSPGSGDTSVISTEYIRRSVLLAVQRAERNAWNSCRPTKAAAAALIASRSSVARLTCHAFRSTSGRRASPVYRW